MKKLHLLYFVFISVFTCDLSAAPAIIDFLEDDLPYVSYSALNNLQSPEDITTSDWTLVDASGLAYRSGQYLFFGYYPDRVYQSVNLVADEPYFITFTGAKSTGDLVMFGLVTAGSQYIDYEYLSLHDEVDTYPIRITVPLSGQYRVELRAIRDFDNVLIDWGAIGVFHELSLINAGADWETFSVWADSMGANSTIGWQRQIKALIDAPTYIDGAVGGQTSTEILQRFLLANEFGDLAIIWAGNNNAIQVSTVLADIAQMVATLPHSNYYVISIHNNAIHAPSSTTYKSVIEINNQLASTYGNRFVDTRSFLISNADINDPDDLEDASAGIVPRSLRVDDIHLNLRGHRYVASLLSGRINALDSDVAHGDINVDGRVDVRDLLLALRILMDLYSPTAAEQARWDVAPLVNGLPQPDGQNTPGDYVVLLRKVIGQIIF